MRPDRWYIRLSCCSCISISSASSSLTTRNKHHAHMRVLGRFHDARDGRERARSYMPRSISGEYVRFEWIMSLALESFLRQIPRAGSRTTADTHASSCRAGPPSGTCRRAGAWFEAFLRSPPCDVARCSEATCAPKQCWPRYHRSNNAAGYNKARLQRTQECQYSTAAGD